MLNIIYGCQNKTHNGFKNYINNENKAFEINFLKKGNGSQILFDKDGMIFSIKNSHNYYLSGPQIEFYKKGNIKSIRVIDSILMKCDTLYNSGEIVITCEGINIDHYINFDLEGKVTSSIYKQRKGN